MKTKKQEYRWVIVGDIGLYIGQYLTRKDAIKDHVYCLYSGDEIDTLGIPGCWKQCRRRGDKVVKALISWEE